MRNAVCVASLAQGLSIDVLPLDNRSDKFWNEFWRLIGLNESKRIKEMI